MLVLARKCVHDKVVVEAGRRLVGPGASLVPPGGQDDQSWFVWWVGGNLAASLLDPLVFFSAENSSNPFDKGELIPRNESKICSFVPTVKKN